MKHMTKNKNNRKRMKKDKLNHVHRDDTTKCTTHPMKQENLFFLPRQDRAETVAHIDRTESG